VVLLAGARAAWITFALVLLFSGWRLLGWKKLLGVFAFGALALGVLALRSRRRWQRVVRTAQCVDRDEEGVDAALSGRTRIWGAALCMAREHPVNGVGARGFREAFAGCDPEPGAAGLGRGSGLHAHQIVLEILSETGVIGLLLWLAGAALAWRAWRFADRGARRRARPAMLALAVTVFPFNTHLAFYSTFWGGLTLLLAALYAGSLLAATPIPERIACPLPAARLRSPRSVVDAAPSGWRLKRRWIHRYCAGAARAIASMAGHHPGGVARWRPRREIRSVPDTPAGRSRRRRAGGAERHHRRAGQPRQLVGRGEAVRRAGRRTARTPRLAAAGILVGRVPQQPALLEVRTAGRSPRLVNIAAA
jgi:hypothetical protein